MTTTHYYKGYQIQRATTVRRKLPLFQIRPHMGSGDDKPVAALSTLKGSKKLIDIFELNERCPCGRPSLPYRLRCQFCTASLHNAIHIYHEKEIAS